MTEMTCEQLRDLAGELALGVAEGRERATAISHLDRCPACREHLHQLTLVGDGLLELVPATEPPVGFENRVMRRLPSRDRRPGRRRGLLAAAAVVIALAAGLGGWAVGSSLSHGRVPPSVPGQDTRPLLSTTLTASDHHPVGTVFAYTGTPSWVYMSIDSEDITGPVSCELEQRDGSHVPVGTFPLSKRYRSWGAPAPVNSATLAGVRLLAADGSVLATAVFPR